MKPTGHLSRRQLLLSVIGLPLVAACGGEKTEEPKPTRRAYFELPTPSPAASGTPAATPSPQPAGATVKPMATTNPNARLATPPAEATLASATPAPPVTLPTTPGERAGALLFTPPAGSPTPVIARRPAPTGLVIPIIKLEARIVNIGTRLEREGRLVWETAAFAVGHHRGSANPGEPGNVVLSGHISSVREGDIFNGLPRVKVGDGIILRTPERDFLYTVDTLRTVLPHEIDVLAPTSERRAILITCVPDRVYSHRLVVTATQV